MLNKYIFIIFVNFAFKLENFQKLFTEVVRRSSELLVTATMSWKTTVFKFVVLSCYCHRWRYIHTCLNKSLRQSTTSKMIQRYSIHRIDTNTGCDMKFTRDY